MDQLRTELTGRVLAAYTTAIVYAAACRPTDAPLAAARVAQTNDSAYAPAVLAVRFRARVPEHPTVLGGTTAASPELLGAQYVRALDRGDSVAVRPMALTVSEFAWLYYLDAPLAQPPYELDPDIMWTQITAQSARGLGRALQRYRGQSFGLTGVACAAATVSGALRLHRCAAHGSTGAGARDSLAMSFVERDGRVKLVGFANQL